MAGSSPMLWASRRGEGFWPCGSTTDAFDELMKWAVRGDMGEVRRTLMKTGSIGLDGGMKVKVLDTGIGKRQVCVLTNSAGEAQLKDEQGVFPAACKALYPVATNEWHLCFERLCKDVHALLLDCNASALARNDPLLFT